MNKGFITLTCNLLFLLLYLWNIRQVSSRKYVKNMCVVSVAIKTKTYKFEKKIDLLIKNKKSFCQKTGFTCYIFESVIIEEDRPIAWQKIHAIEKVLNTSCKEILYVDADTVFLKKFLFPKYNTNIGLVSDKNGINTGVMFIKNTYWSKTFFKNIRKTDQFDFHPWWEQAAIMAQYKNRSIRKHFTLLKSQYNSYEFKQDNLIYHTAGCKFGCLRLWTKALNLSLI